MKLLYNICIAFLSTELPIPFSSVNKLLYPFSPIVALILGLELMGLASFIGAANVGVPITSLWDTTSILIDKYLS